MTAKMTAACLPRLVMRPNIQTQAMGTRSIRNVSKAFVQAEGFSNG